jgi:hypothetical protein
VYEKIKMGAPHANKDTDERLREVVDFSFDRLSYKAQDMFLDAVSVLHRKDSKMSEVVWKSWHGGCSLHFPELQRRSLISVKNGVLTVHDVIRSLGQQIIRSNDDAPGTRPSGVNRPRRNFYGRRLWVKGAGIADSGQLDAFDDKVCCRNKDNKCPPRLWPVTRLRPRGTENVKQHASSLTITN